MELWTLAVITVESAAQIFYRAMKDATGCELLRQVCTDILVDEAAHVAFQRERLHVVFRRKSPLARLVACCAWTALFDGVALLVWLAHRTLFRAGGVPLASYLRRMRGKRRVAMGRTSLFGARRTRSAREAPQPLPPRSTRSGSSAGVEDRKRVPGRGPAGVDDVGEGHRVHGALVPCTGCTSRTRRV
jgi:hypothetical protein